MNQQGDPTFMATGSSPPGNMMQGRMGGPPQNAMMQGMQGNPQGGPMYPSGDMKGWPQGGMPRSKCVPAVTYHQKKQWSGVELSLCVISVKLLTSTFIFQLIPSAAVPPAEQPGPVWAYDDEQLHGWTWACQWGWGRTDGPNARTDARTNARTNGHEPHGNGTNANGT